MNNRGRLFSYAAVHQEGKSDKDERNAEALTHIKNHILLKTDLWFLYEFDEEAHTEATDEEGTDEESSMKLRQSVLVHQDLEHSQEEVAESLIKLCRMLWLRLVSELENKAPRERGYITVNFRIEEISKADKGCCKADCNCKMVHDPDEIKVIFTTIMSCKPPHCNKESYCTAMAGKTALPRHEYLPKSFPAAKIIVWLIEETMSETSSYNGSDKKSVKKRIKQDYRHTFSLEEPLENEPSQNES